MKWRWIVLCDISTSFCFGHSLFMLVFLLKHPRYGQSSISVNQCHCVISLKLVSVWLHILWNWSQSGCVISAKLFPIWMCDFCETVLNLIVSFLWNWSRTDCVIFFFFKLVSVWSCDCCENCLGLIVWFLWKWSVWLCDFYETGLDPLLRSLIALFLWNWSQPGCVISVKLSQSDRVISVKLASIWLCDFFEIDVCVCDFCETELSLLVWLLCNWPTCVIALKWSHSDCVVSMKLVKVRLCDFCKNYLRLVVLFLWKWSQFDCVKLVWFLWSLIMQFMWNFQSDLYKLWLCGFYKTGLTSDCLISVKLVSVWLHDVHETVCDFWETGFSCLSLTVGFTLIVGFQETIPVWESVSTELLVDFPTFVTMQAMGFVNWAHLQRYYGDNWCGTVKWWEKNLHLQDSPFKAQDRSVNSHSCYAYCQEFLPCLFLPFQSVHRHFFQNLSWYFPALAVANTV